MNFFDKVNNIIRGSEASLVNLLSALAPWLAPLAPAYLTWSHMSSDLDYPKSVALAVAAVVEVLGLAAISTTLDFWSHNRRYTSEERQAPVWLAIASFVFYLSVVITVNVLLDASKAHWLAMEPERVEVIANGLLTTLSIPAAVILAARTQHSRLLSQISEDRRERQMARARNQTTRQPNKDGSVPNEEGATSRRKRQFFTDFQNGSLSVTMQTHGLEFDTQGVQHLAEVYGTTSRSVYRWLEELRNGQKETV